MTSKRSLLFLPVINGKGFSKAEVELLQDLGVEIKLRSNGSYTIDGETPEEIKANYGKTIEELKEWARRGPTREPMRLIRGGKTKREK